MQKDNKPLISVIIPAYNAEAHLGRAIQSVANQSYKHLEIIVIDDGSTDNTGNIADGYKANDHRIKVLHVKNGGEAKSRNLGLSIATGAYISFCDADDYMHQDMVDKMFAAIKRDKSDIAVCAWRYVDEYGIELFWEKPNLKTCILTSDEAIVQFLTTGNIEGFCWNKLFSRSLYDSIKVRYDEKKLSFCDVLANLKLLMAAHRVSYVGECLYDYYQISTACTHTVNIKKDYDYIETISEVLTQIEKFDLKREASIYTINRLNKYLYGMYRSRNEYEPSEYMLYYVGSYEKFLKVNLLKKVIYAIEYPLEEPLKFIVKVWIVSKKYREYKTGRFK